MPVFIVTERFTVHIPADQVQLGNDFLLHGHRAADHDDPFSPKRLCHEPAIFVYQILYIGFVFSRS
jgi:hypothetical protein